MDVNNLHNLQELLNKILLHLEEENICLHSLLAQFNDFRKISRKVFTSFWNTLLPVILLAPIGSVEMRASLSKFLIEINTHSPVCIVYILLDAEIVNLHDMKTAELDETLITILRKKLQDVGGDAFKVEISEKLKAYANLYSLKAIPYNFTFFRSDKPDASVQIMYKLKHNEDLISHHLLCILKCSAKKIKLNEQEMQMVLKEMLQHIVISSSQTKNLHPAITTFKPKR